MCKNGFSHRLWSGYVSNNTMTKPELLEFTLKLHKAFPWLIKCEGSMDATVITDVFDIRQMILDSADDDDARRHNAIDPKKTTQVYKKSLNCKLTFHTHDS